MSNLVCRGAPAHRSEFCRSLEICFTQGSEACQASAIAALQSLCDPRLTLRTTTNHPGGGAVDATAAHLADSLPSRETLAEIMTVLLNPFTCELRTNFSIQLLTMRTFVLLASRGGDTTFAVLTECLAAKHRTLFSLLRKLAADFEAGSSACRDCVGATADFLGQLMELTPLSSTVYDEPSSATPQRTLCLTAAELAWVGLWPVAAADSTAEQVADRRRTHPLTLLQGRLVEAVSEQLQQQQQQQQPEEEGGTLHELRQLKVSRYFFFFFIFYAGTIIRKLFSAHGPFIKG